jgi:hypothetical protein
MNKRKERSSCQDRRYFYLRENKPPKNYNMKKARKNKTISLRAEHMQGVEEHNLKREIDLQL